MFATNKLKTMHQSAETTVIQLEDGKTLQVSMLPRALQVAIATLDEWTVEAKYLELQLAKSTRAIASLKADIIANVTQIASTPISSSSPLGASTTPAPAPQKPRKRKK